jgi:hypothetical protein
MAALILLGFIGSIAALTGFYAIERAVARR